MWGCDSHNVAHTQFSPVDPIHPDGDFQHRGQRGAGRKGSILVRRKTTLDSPDPLIQVLKGPQAHKVEPLRRGRSPQLAGQLVDWQFDLPYVNALHQDIAKPIVNNIVHCAIQASAFTGGDKDVARRRRPVACNHLVQAVRTNSIAIDL